MNLNNYNKIANLYNASHTKPDKLFSILPTVLTIAKDSDSPTTIVDLGCGDGFFTFPLARLFPNARVVGIDNSTAQIAAARNNLESLPYHHVTFIEGDIFKDPIPQSDVILAPFVLGYCPRELLDKFLLKIRECLRKNGTLIIVLDDPQGIDNSKFGARKSIAKEKITIELFNEDGKTLPTLYAFYHTPRTVLQKLEALGFDEIKVHQATISSEGINRYGEKWWSDYKEHSELCYISCTKP